MRLKSFTANSMAEAMAMVRAELGDEAIIVTTQRAAGGKGVRITAAMEPQDADDAIARMLSGSDETELVESLRTALVQHGTPARLVERLCNAARASEHNDPVLALASALEAGYAFAPLPDLAAPRPFMLVGPPGVGKSIAVAKLAARSVLKRRSVAVITADSIRAGAIEQLAAFTRILQIDLISVRGPETLAQAVQDAAGNYDIVFVDSPGVNPFKQKDMEYLQSLIEASDVEPILALAAGSDPAEAAEMGEAFGAIGATRLFASRLDTTRRLGGILAAADAAQLMFCDVSVNPHVAQGLCPISPVAMARLILPRELQPDYPEPPEPAGHTDSEPLTEASTL
jgi:flagellar biosynthesis protein FlhF